MRRHRRVQVTNGGAETRYRGARGLDPALIKELEKQYGFDKPPLDPASISPTRRV